MPVSLAAAMLLLPVAASSAEAHERDRRDDRRHSRQNVRHSKEYRKSSYRHRGRDYRPRYDVRHHGHYRSSRDAYYRDHGHHYRPSRVRYLRHGHHRSIGFYLATPYVVVHGPRFAARVVFYPGEVPLYEPGYCPSEVHYHPYEHDYDERDYEDGFHGRVSIQIGANF
jgi:hypothetical protein